MDNEKERFLTAYWNQEIMYDDQRSGYTVSDYLGGYMSEKAYALLTSLEDITDEDAIKVFNITYATSQQNIDTQTNIRSGKLTVRDFQSKYAIDLMSEYLELHEVIELIDYFRSKSYALPFNGYSVEELIQKGWMKIKTKK